MVGFTGINKVNFMDMWTKQLGWVALLLSTVTSFTISAQEVVASKVQSELPHTVIRLPNVHPGRDAVYAYAKTLLAESLRVTKAQYGTLIQLGRVIKKINILKIFKNYLVFLIVYT